ncbi:MAG: YkgJ family cysteine cluster protein [Promethearchaeota archaeon]
MPKMREILRFKCQKCGKCCSDAKTFINLTYKDILRLKNGLNSSVEDLLHLIGFYTFNEENIEEYMKDYMVFSPIITEKGNAFIGILKREDSRCVFLNEDKKCAIYSFRPMICRTFPFTYDIVKENEKKFEIKLIYAKKGLDYCPGISKKSPLVKTKKKLKIITEFLAEIKSDRKMIESWNKLVNNGEITAVASKYIQSIVKMDAKIKKSNLSKSYTHQMKKRKFSNF